MFSGGNAHERGRRGRGNAVGGESLGLRCRRSDTIEEGEGGWGCAETALRGPTLSRNSQSPTPIMPRTCPELPTRTSLGSDPRMDLAGPEAEGCCERSLLQLSSKFFLEGISQWPLP